MSTATLVKKLDNMRGDAAVYELDPPLDEIRFVTVSAVDLNFGGFDMGDYRNSETMIFPSDGETTTDWGELAMIPYKSHTDALADLGYDLA